MSSPGLRLLRCSSLLHALPLHHLEHGDLGAAGCQRSAVSACTPAKFKWLLRQGTTTGLISAVVKRQPPPMRSDLTPRWATDGRTASMRRKAAKTAMLETTWSGASTAAGQSATDRDDQRMMVAQS